MSKDFLHYLLTNLVHNPDQISIEENENDKQIIYAVQAADEDMGLIIGKHGKTINAIRALVKLNNQLNQSEKMVIIQLPERQTETNPSETTTEA